MVLPGTERDAALVGHRLVEAVRSVAVRQAAGWSLSVSIGVTGWHPGEDTVKSADALSRADQALYAAKGNGKNRAASYRPPQVSKAQPTSATAPAPNPAN